MGRKKPNTPRSKIKACLRQLTLRSRERSTALKTSGYKCVDCDIKQSKAKDKEVAIEVHHDPPLKDRWEEIIDLIADLLASPQYPLCKNCHHERHKEKDDGTDKTMQRLQQ